MAKRLRIPTNTGTKVVEILTRKGHLIAHVSAGHAIWPISEIPLKAEAFTITHEPTRLAVAKKLTRDQAFKFIEKLAALDWNFAEPRDAPKETREKTSEILAGNLAKTIGGPTDDHPEYTIFRSEIGRPIRSTIKTEPVKSEENPS